MVTNKRKYKRNVNPRYTASYYATETDKVFNQHSSAVYGDERKFTEFVNDLEILAANDDSIS